MFIQQAHVVAALDELGKTLSPYSLYAVTTILFAHVSTIVWYNEYISFHAKQKGNPGVHRKLVITALSLMMAGTAEREVKKEMGTIRKMKKVLGLEMRQTDREHLMRILSDAVLLIQKRTTACSGWNPTTMNHLH
jgi:hypothetical protein